MLTYLLHLKMSYVAIIIILLLELTLKINGRIPDEPSIPNNNMITPTSTTSITPVPFDHAAQSTGVCMQAESDICLIPHNTTNTGFPSPCECFPHPKISNFLICCNITDIEKVTSCASKPEPNSSVTHWTSIFIHNLTVDEIIVSNSFWKTFESIGITDGNIKKISDNFTKFTKIKCLNISNNNIGEINSPRAFLFLSNLQVLDLSYNNLSTMPNMANIENINNLIADIRGNSVMQCKSVYESIEKGLKFEAPDSSYCLRNSTFTWFNTTESMPIRSLEKLKELQSKCPVIPGYGNCTCGSERISFSNKDAIFTAKVDCSNLGLEELPKNLPTNTWSLNVSNNKIKSLEAFNVDPSYKNIVRFYADDNLIDAIFDLEGTTFIENFQELFLKRNKIKSIPIYVISNTLDRNPQGRKVNLAGNKLHCDCNSAKVLRLWLISRSAHIIDYDSIECENMHQKVIELSEMKLCQSQHDWTDYIYYLIAAEVFLLVGLIMKVSYDYWIFKTAGYLPWPANKMPKLPCDWLCES